MVDISLALQMISGAAAASAAVGGARLGLHVAQEGLRWVKEALGGTSSGDWQGLDGRLKDAASSGPTGDAPGYTSSEFYEWHANELSTEGSTDERPEWRDRVRELYRGL